MSVGRLFQISAPATGNDREPNVTQRTRGTHRIGSTTNDRKLINLKCGFVNISFLKVRLSEKMSEILGQVSEN